MRTWVKRQKKRLRTTEFYYVTCPCKKPSIYKKRFTNATFVENMTFTYYSKKYVHLLDRCPKLLKHAFLNQTHKV